MTPRDTITEAEGDVWVKFIAADGLPTSRAKTAKEIVDAVIAALARDGWPVAKLQQVAWECVAASNRGPVGDFGLMVSPAIAGDMAAAMHETGWRLARGGVA